MVREIRILRELERRERRRKLWTYYPDTGPLRRELYPKHLQFFRLGATTDERLALAGNRVGKTEGMGGYEVALHLTGLYPDWWEGRRFARPISAWAAGTTAVTTRDVMQLALLGPTDEIGTGLIPGDTIIGTRPRSGVPDAVDTVRVRHVSGGTSRLGFKSYEQGRKNFEGTKKDLLWFDEEPPFEVYQEGLMRTMSTNPTEPPGMVLCTFTPMQGMSETVMYFLPDGLPDTDQ